MQKFPVLRTSLKGFELQPLEKKHSQFYLELLNDKSVQKTLFRSPKIVKEEAFHTSYDAMYTEKPKKITYILSLGKNKERVYFGYVSIKLIDWTNKSAYLSVAIKNDPTFRGKGYSLVCFNAFFKYLFSIGFLKIYGRTYEENTPTIKLNISTGFRFIGRQKNFVIYKSNESQDALFFEKLHPALISSYENRHTKLLLPLYRRLNLYLKNSDSLPTLEIPRNIKTEIHKWIEKKGKYIPRFRYKIERIKGFTKDLDILKRDVEKYCKENLSQLPPDWQQYIGRIIEHISNRESLAKSIGTKSYEYKNKNYYMAGIPKEYYSEAVHLAKSCNTMDVFQESTKAISSTKALHVAKIINKEFFGNHFKLESILRTSPGGIDFTKTTLSLSKNHHWTRKSLSRFLIHEAIHAITHLNAYKSGLYLLTCGFTPGYLSFQEGLAVYITQFLTGDKMIPLRSICYWRLKKYFSDMPVYDLYATLKEDSLLRQYDNSELEQILVRIWRTQNESYGTLTYKRLSYLPATLYISEFLKNKKASDYLWAPISVSDYDLLSSQFLGRDLSFDIETLLKIKNRTKELLSPNSVK